MVITIALLWILNRIETGSFTSHILINLVLVTLGIGFSVACLRHGALGERHFGRKDASPIVADEVAGQALALLLLPWQAGVQPEQMRWNALLCAIAFVAFRLMDILKLPPARALQQLEGGAGVLVDDLIAGVHALILTQVAARFILPHLL